MDWQQQIAPKYDQAANNNNNNNNNKFKHVPYTTKTIYLSAVLANKKCAT